MNANEQHISIVSDPFDLLLIIGGKPGEGPSTGGVGDPGDPFFEPENDDWLGDTDGLGHPDKVKPIMISGKVSGLLFDHFGDF